MLNGNKECKVVLIVIYNHRYDKNIDIVEKLYSMKFTDIFHLMPFYDGERKNVIPVYENSHYFQGYIAQGLKNYFDEKYDHYFFIGDDLVLNPIINSSNYKGIFNLDIEKSYIQRIASLNFYLAYWFHNKNAVDYQLKLSGLEITNMLPSAEEALSRMEELGIEQNYLRAEQIFKIVTDEHAGKKYKTIYPMARSYSDIVIVSKYTIKKFCQYCGIFAASHLFVEVALPTSLFLASKNIVCDKELTMKGLPLWGGDNIEKYFKKYEKNLNKLLDDFPEDKLYLHPVKLSKWSINI